MGENTADMRFGHLHGQRGMVNAGPVYSLSSSSSSSYIAAWTRIHVLYIAKLSVMSLHDAAQ